jgi:hypothetical protein
MEGLGMSNFGIFYDHLEYFDVIWYILWQFCGHLVYFGNVYQENVVDLKVKTRCCIKVKRLVKLFSQIPNEPNGLSPVLDKLSRGLALSPTQASSFAQDVKKMFQ